MHWTRNYAFIMVFEGVAISNYGYKPLLLRNKTKTLQILNKESLFMYYTQYLLVCTNTNQTFLLLLKILEKNNEITFITLEINSEFVAICKSVITFIFQKRNRFMLFLRKD